MTKFLKLDIKIKENLRVIERRISKAMTTEFNNRIQNGLEKISRDIKKLVKELITDSSEIKSLKGGVLKGDFGIPTGEDPTGAIIDAIVNSVDVVHTIVASGGRGFTGGVTINIQPTHFSNLTSLPGVKVITKKGAVLPWLEWLLTLGDKIIITEHHVEYKKGAGRSGLASMTTGGTFRVNPSFSGTVENNFISRAFQGSENRIASIIKRHIG